MQGRDLYAKLLGIEHPWVVRDVEARLDAGEVEVFISFADGKHAPCPECGKACGRHDTRTRTWRHLDTMQYQTKLTAEVPRVKCPKHGVKQVKVPWAEPGSRFTAIFETLVIDMNMNYTQVCAVAGQKGAIGIEFVGFIYSLVGPVITDWIAASDINASGPVWSEIYVRSRESKVFRLS